MIVAAGAARGTGTSSSCRRLPVRYRRNHQLVSSWHIYTCLATVPCMPWPHGLTPQTDTARPCSRSKRPTVGRRPGPNYDKVSPRWPGARPEVDSGWTPEKRVELSRRRVKEEQLVPDLVIHTLSRMTQRLILHASTIDILSRNLTETSMRSSHKRPKLTTQQSNSSSSNFLVLFFLETSNSAGHPPPLPPPLRLRVQLNIHALSQGTNACWA